MGLYLYIVWGVCKYNKENCVYNMYIIVFLCGRGGFFKKRKREFLIEKIYKKKGYCNERVFASIF